MPYPYFPQSYVPYGTQQQMQMPQMSTMIHVQSENDARNYPVAPGNSITFINDNEPFIYVKTASASQLGQPSFERYRVIREAAATEQKPPAVQESRDSGNATTENAAYALKTETDALRAEVERLKATVDKMATQAKKPVSKGDSNE